MGKRSEGVHHAARMSAAAGGSLDTMKHRRLHWAEFSRLMARMGHTLGSVHDVTDWMPEFFVWFLVAGATKAGTLANYRASIAVIQRTAGQDVGEATNSRHLQLERRDRSGKHRARTPAEYAELVDAARRVAEGALHIISLMRWLGLRRREALRCGPSLESWRSAILRGSRRLAVELGAKNKRPRRTEVLEGHVQETLAAIEAALAYCRIRNFELVTGRSGKLETGKSRLKTHFENLPMRGPLSSHSLRYTYAVDYANAELDKGVPPVDVLVALSERLGHGPSRVKMILDVYCWQIRHRFPPKIKLPADFVPHRRTSEEARSRSATLGKTPQQRGRLTGGGRRMQRKLGI
jgi:hypothetical protein